MNNIEMKRYTSAKWNFALDVPERWNSFPPMVANSPWEVIRFASREEGTHLVIVFRMPHSPKQPLEQRLDEMQQELARQGFGNFASSETTMGPRPAMMLEFD